MTWEETIQYIRTKPEYAFLVEKAYFDESLHLNVERFKNSEEYIETVRLIKSYKPQAKNILDIGCGNGISSISFAIDGYDVSAVEPDPSNTIGAGAIRKLEVHYNLTNIKVYEAFAEDIHFNDNTFDIVYVRQAMHHAHDLLKFISECARVLKKGGILFTVRDHVVFNKKDKDWFLINHPLQKFYGGENAFSPEEYKNAMTSAGLRVEKEIKHFESVINYFPTTKEEFESGKINFEINSKENLIKKIGFFANIPLLYNLYKRYLKSRDVEFANERHIAGSVYSYISIKQ